ncbi:TPA: tRNA (guanine(10)-N(2))-dimethyltransferase [Candidatus Woesearchaeota archaeon]|nr:tRNA (guanine(10)-N(2))-dimethyltransferase [Candidatus Woesearchaeota archaeon]
MMQEHSIKLNLNLPEKDVSREMDVFYNPVMISNRNISILVLKSWPQDHLRIADPLAGSGIRSLRFLQELPAKKIEHITVNDANELFPNEWKKNIQLNSIKTKKVVVTNEEASLFLLKQEGFDYIDIDPYGSPNPFLAAAVARLSREGILAVTATDTAALTGTYPKVTQRKYWATSLKNYQMHEIGLRILIRRVQLQGVQFDKALMPILSYHKDHYFRIYFRVEKGKEKCDVLLKQMRYFLFCRACLRFTTSMFNCEHCVCGKDLEFAGPLWAGDIFDKKLIKTMVKMNTFPEEESLLRLLHEESENQTAGFYDLHTLARLYKDTPPRQDRFLSLVKGTRTHFSPTGFKTKTPYEELKKAFTEANEK